MPEILDIYENEFNKLSERYFVEFPWPGAELVSGMVQNGESKNDRLSCLMHTFSVLTDQTFLVLYKELQFRHIYAKHKVCTREINFGHMTWSHDLIRVLHAI